MDDANDQAARVTLPLAADARTALQRLNARHRALEARVGERWRQVAGRSREGAALTPAQLGGALAPPWERATAANKVPYYIKWVQLLVPLIFATKTYSYVSFITRSFRFECLLYARFFRLGNITPFVRL